MGGSEVSRSTIVIMIHKGDDDNDNDLVRGKKKHTVEPRSKASAYKAKSAYKAFRKNP